MHWQVYIRGQERRMHHAALELCNSHPSNSTRNCRAFLSDKSGKKYKPTSKTDDGQN